MVPKGAANVAKFFLDWTMRMDNIKKGNCIGPSEEYNNHTQLI
jgi:hypothetical protein